MTGLIQDIAIILTVCMLLSIGFMSFNLPPLLGYILAGTIIGPTLLAVEQPAIIHMLGEFGLILLLFLVGLEVSLEDFKRTWASTLIFLTVQFILSFVCAWLVATVFGLTWGLALLISFLLTLSSTAVVITLLENLSLINSKTGSFSISILIAQDLAFMPMILILKMLGSGGSIVRGLASLIIALVLLIVCVLYFGKEREGYSKLYYKNLLRKPEVTTLIGASFCFVFAGCSSMFDLSPAYGSFLAGLMLGNRWDRESLVKAFIPITSMMMMIFFLSVGFRLSVGFIVHNVGIVLIWLIIITLVKSLTNIAGLIAIRWPVRSTFLVASLLAQMSEFSFVLIEQAQKSRLLSGYNADLLLTLTTLSLAAGSTFPLLVKSMRG